VPGNNTTVLPGRVASNGTGGAFAYQAIGGFAVPLRLLPDLELTAEYRYSAMDEARIRVERVAFGTINGTTPVARTAGYFGNHNRSVLVGLRYAFN